jgi:hypothetical protein
VTAKDVQEFLEREAAREIFVDEETSDSGYLVACAIRSTAQKAIELWNKEAKSEHAH